MEFKRISDLREAMGGRRFLLTCGAGVVNSFLFAVGTMTEGGFVTLTLATVGAYIGANTFEKAKGAASNGQGAGP